MSDSSKSERIVIDESILENLFGPRTNDSQPEVTPGAPAETVPEPPVQPEQPDGPIGPEALPNAPDQRAADAPAEPEMARQQESLRKPSTEGLRQAPAAPVQPRPVIRQEAAPTTSRPERTVPPVRPEASGPSNQQVPVRESHSDVVSDGTVKSTDEAVYDRQQLLSRALMLDTESDPPPSQPGVVEPRRTEAVAAPVPATPPAPAVESQVVPADRVNDPEWLHARGNRLLASGDLSGAEESYRQVLKLDAESWSAHYNLGLVLERLARHDEARAEYREAIRIDGDRIEAVIRGGFVDLKLDAYEDALAAFEQVLQSKPGNAPALFGKGCALHYLERFSEADECYKTLLVDHPTNEELLSNLAAVSLSLRDFPGALECAEMLPEEAAEPQHRLQLQIECAVALGDEEKVAQQSAQLVEIMEGSFEAWFNLGVACQHTGRLEVAVDAYKQALAVNPDSPEAQVNLGAVLHESENLAEAREFYEAALRSGYADHPGVNWNLGLAAESLGRFDVAEKAYAVTVRSQPNWKEAVGRLTRLNPSFEATQ